MTPHQTCEAIQTGERCVEVLLLQDRLDAAKTAVAVHEAGEREREARLAAAEARIADVHSEMKQLRLAVSEVRLDLVQRMADMQQSVGKGMSDVRDTMTRLFWGVAVLVVAGAISLATWAVQQWLTALAKGP